MSKSAQRWTSALLTILTTLISNNGLANEPSQTQPPRAGWLLEAYDHDGMEEGARQLFELSVFEIADAFGWANAELKGRKTSPLYCEPPTQALTAPQLIDLLRKGITNEPPLPHPLSDMPLAFALLVSLQRAYPCSQTIPGAYDPGKTYGPGELKSTQPQQQAPSPAQPSRPTQQPQPPQRSDADTRAALQKYCREIASKREEACHKTVGDVGGMQNHTQCVEFADRSYDTCMKWNTP
jgi:hypothetical protein